MKETLKGWAYAHKIGAIHVESWGNPFLVVTEDRYLDGEKHGYTYYKLGVEYKDLKEAQKDSKTLTALYGMKDKIFTPKESQEILLKVQAEFKNAEISKLS